MTLMTARVVAITALSISAQAISQLLIRAFYALKNTRIPFFITLAIEIVFITSCWLSVFVLHQGVLGIAVATSVTGILEMFLLLFFLNRRVPGFLGKALWWPQLKMTIASFLMAIFLYLPFRILDELVFNTSRTIELILLTITTGTIGTLVYLYFAALFDVREIYIVQSILAKFGGWKKTLARSQEVLIETASGQSEEVV
jgi:putative peptidoglycan lipid II flippase